MTTQRPRKISRLGVVLTLAIILAVIAFGMFKRKGARKPPPIPKDATGAVVPLVRVQPDSYL